MKNKVWSAKLKRVVGLTQRIRERIRVMRHKHPALDCPTGYRLHLEDCDQEVVDQVLNTHG